MVDYGLGDDLLWYHDVLPPYLASQLQLLLHGSSLLRSMVSILASLRICI